MERLGGHLGEGLVRLCSRIVNFPSFFQTPSGSGNIAKEEGEAFRGYPLKSMVVQPPAIMGASSELVLKDHTRRLWLGWEREQQSSSPCQFLPVNYITATSKVRGANGQGVNPYINPRGGKMGLWVDPFKTRRDLRPV
jgi:hypothetical protein